MSGGGSQRRDRFRGTTRKLRKDERCCNAALSRSRERERERKSSHRLVTRWRGYHLQRGTHSSDVGDCAALRCCAGGEGFGEVCVGREWISTRRGGQLFYRLFSTWQPTILSAPWLERHVFTMGPAWTRCLCPIRRQVNFRAKVRTGGTSTSRVIGSHDESHDITAGVACVLPTRDPRCGRNASAR